MSWSVLRRIVADVVNAKVSGTQAVGGALLTIEVSFRLTEWPWDTHGPVTLIPKPMLVRVMTRQGEHPLGMATPAPEQVVIPSADSSTTAVQFTIGLSTSALAELEAARDGRGLELATNLVAYPIFAAPQANVAIRPTSMPFKFKVPLEDWLAVLKNVGFCDTLITELRLPTTGPESTSLGRQRVAKAVSARNEGRYRSTVQECRIALDVLKTAGFGGRAPDEVAQFLQKNARNLSQAERFSALQVALQLFLSPAHHDGVPDEEFSREDADLAIAITAALLRLAPRWGAEPTATSADTKEDSP